MTEITAAGLNQQIVQMRPTISMARFRLASRLIRRIRSVKKSKKDSGKMERKTTRMVEEIHSLKTIRADDVSKFALINTKILKELNIRGDTSAYKRALFKLGTEKVIVQVVDIYRKDHPEWHLEVPFLLQRLGLQYRSKRKRASSFSIFDILTNEQQFVKNERGTEKSTETLSDSTTSKSTKTRSKLKDTIAIVEPIQMPIPLTKIDLENDLALPIRRGQGEIRRFDLNEDMEINANIDEHFSQSLSISTTVPVSSFFLGGQEEDYDEQNGKSGDEEDNIGRGKLQSIFCESLVNSDKKISYQKRHKCTSDDRFPKEKRNAPNTKIQQNRKVQEEKLHPSWVAKKKLKQKMELAQRIVSQGKRTLFDNDNDDDD